MHFPPVSIGTEPGPDIAVFVVGGVVLDQNGTLARVASRPLLQETQVGGGVEDRLLAVVKAGLEQFNGAQDFDAFTLPGHGDFRWLADSAPSGI